MRRKTVIVILLLSALALSALCLAACDRGSSEDDRPKDISRMVSAFYAGECEDFAVTFERGSKEEPFIADGKTTSVVDFSSLRVIPLRATEASEISFVLSGSAGESVSGKLTAGTFGEFRAEVAAEFAPVKVTLTAGELTREIDLGDVLSGCLSGYDAVEIARREFASRSDAEGQEGEQAREIFVKLITGDRTAYYYYVSFIGEGVDYWAVLLDPATGEVVSKR